MKENITPINKEGRPHGYWESYFTNRKLFYKGNYINGNADGYWEIYDYDGQLKYKKYYT